MKQNDVVLYVMTLLVPYVPFESLVFIQEQQIKYLFSFRQYHT